MPPSWSSRLLYNAANNATNTGSSDSVASSSTYADSRNKPLPKPPPHSFEPPPTLYGSRPSPPSPSRRVNERGQQTAHSRSSSHPLPKLFSRKKSIPGFEFDDNNVPLDDNLVPVLADSESSGKAPRKIFGGKKAKSKDEDEKIVRRCMCCDSKVSVPRELDKFRCLACLTINEVETRKQELTSKNEVQLTLGRTKAIVDQCIVRYLEYRCQARYVREDKSYSSTAGVTSRDHAAGRRSDLSASQSRTGVGVRATDVVADQGSPATMLASQSPSSASQTSSGYPITLPIRQPNVSPRDVQGSPPTGLSTASNFTFPARKPVQTSVPSRPPPPPPAQGQYESALGIYGNTPKQSGGFPSAQPAQSPTKPLSTRYDYVKTIFRPLENYIASTYGNRDCLAMSFSTLSPAPGTRSRSESQIPLVPTEANIDRNVLPTPELFSEFDAKTLLLGDLGENSSWWTGKHDQFDSNKAYRRKRIGEVSKRSVSSRSPNINFEEVAEWYSIVHSVHQNWQDRIVQIRLEGSGATTACLEEPTEVVDIDTELEEARDHAVRALLKITENVLKKPGAPLRDPEDIRYLLIVLANPSLFSVSSSADSPKNAEGFQRSAQSPNIAAGKRRVGNTRSLQHTGLLKRIFGLLAHSSDTCHRYLVNWFARFEQDQFTRIVELVGSFVNHRIKRSMASKTQRGGILDDGGLIPDISGSAMNTSAQLHAALGLSGSVKARPGEAGQDTQWADDWQLKAAAKIMSLLFAANGIWQGSPKDSSQSSLDPASSRAPAALRRTKDHVQLLATSNFYNTLLDYRDMVADFRVWETKRDKFAFCQYPLFLSMGTKIKILEYDARRQMETKAREAYFDQVIRQRAIDGQFHLKIRRECLVDDSLRQISAAVGAGQEELKKSLRVHFSGEEGIDAGGLRKEWFLMLIRDIFDPNHGMFVYDEESHACYFNPHSFETSDQYYLVGALLGLAIYNSTILDIAFPAFAFRKLLAAAPAVPISTASSLTGAKGQMTYSLADLAELRPSLAAGLQQLLDFEGDVETTFCWDFVASVEKYGTIIQVPLMSEGQRTPVTNSNRHEFVDMYVRYLLDTSVAKQFEPFKRGFFTVCAGNALSLFRAEEIELLVRGSAEALDVTSLKAVAVYENWRDEEAPHHPIIDPAESVPVIQWFWDAFLEATPTAQRKLLAFVTGSDRIPAVGATSLVLRVVAGGDGHGGGGPAEMERFPVARTCFNMLVLWRYPTPAKLQEKLWRAVDESEGFGLK